MTDVVPYRLSIASELVAFRPELEYASDFLDRCYFVQRRAEATRVLHYGANPPKGAVAMPAKLFPDGAWLDGGGIHPNPAQLRVLLADSAVSVAGGRLDYDALALIFCMLSRLEERDAETTDRYGRFEFGAASLGTHTAPLADCAARDLAVRLTGDAAPQSRTQYEVMLTHDVDRLRGFHRPLEPLRWAVGDIVKRRHPANAVTRVRDAWFSGEPWRSVDMLMALSENHNLTSRFYFMGPTELSMDSPYAHTMPGLLRRVTDSIQQHGHVVGFHPGFGTATDAAQWNRQRDGLEAVTGVTLSEGRQHVLGYDATVTPDIWNDAGMVLDTTLGFPEFTGFRAGTCRRFAAYSLRRRRSLRLEQLSTAVMDFGLMGGKYRDLSTAAALEECEAAARTCREFGGTLVILYHTGQTQQPMREFYENLLERVQ